MYGALHAGMNPVFYVSRSPWNLFVPLIEYLRRQGHPLAQDAEAAALHAAGEGLVQASDLRAVRSDCRADATSAAKAEASSGSLK